MNFQLLISSIIGKNLKRDRRCSFLTFSSFLGKSQKRSAKKYFLLGMYAVIAFFIIPTLSLIIPTLFSTIILTASFIIPATSLVILTLYSIILVASFVIPAKAGIWSSTYKFIGNNYKPLNCLEVLRSKSNFYPTSNTYHLTSFT